MYRKSHFLYISRLSCRGKQLFVYMRGGRGISEAFFQEATEGDFSGGIAPHKKRKRDKVWGILWERKNGRF
jgi:hypothetical protein